jgi:hypothetical protein
MSIDLSGVGIGATASDGVNPPPGWDKIRFTARTILKANRVVYEVDRAAIGFGISHDDFARLRPLLLVLECAVYQWDDEVESAQQAGLLTGLTVGRPEAVRLRGLVDEILTDSEAANVAVTDLEEYFRLESDAVSASSWSEESFIQLTRRRYADIRMLFVVLSQLAGLGSLGADVMDTSGPFWELMEVRDDLTSVTEDAASGGFNSLNYVSRGLSTAEAQRYLNDFARSRAEELATRLSRASPEVWRSTMLLFCPSPLGREARAVRVMTFLPAVFRRWLVRRFVVPALAGVFAEAWLD